MSDISIIIPDPEGWKRATEQGKQIMKRAVELTAQAAWSNIAREAPVDQGRLAGSFGIEQIDDLSWMIFTNVAYAAAVQDGSAPHTIEAVNGKALAFEIAGQSIVVRRVQHPGAAPNPYITRAFDAARARTDEFMQRAIREVAG